MNLPHRGSNGTTLYWDSSPYFSHWVFEEFTRYTYIFLRFYYKIIMKKYHPEIYVSSFFFPLEFLRMMTIDIQFVL